MWKNTIITKRQPLPKISILALMGNIQYIVCSQLELQNPSLHGRHILSPLLEHFFYSGGVKFIKQGLEDFLCITSAYVYLISICRVNSTCVQCPWQPEEGARSLGAGVMYGYGFSELRSSGKSARALTLSHFSSPLDLQNVI